MSRPKKVGGSTVAAEVVLGVAYFLFVEQAHVADAAVGKLVDQRAAQPFGQVVVDQGTDVGADGGEDYHEDDVHAVVGHGLPGSWGVQ